MRILNSPNKSARNAGVAIDAIIIHADAGKTDQGTIDWILTKHTDPNDNVSYHYFIGRTGEVYRLVADAAKAWHAGISTFEGRPDCNQYSIGVSFANNQAGETFRPVQIDAGVATVARLCRAYQIPIDRITTHAHVAPGRKHDPGPLFPWDEFIARIEAVLK